jgi:ABC-type transport system involved in multi-copper enzyme maturation permease subunit
VVPGFYLSSPLTFMAVLEHDMGTGALQLLLFGRSPGFMGGTPAGGGGLLELAAMVATYGFTHVMIAGFCLCLAIAVVRAVALGQAESGPLRPPPAEPARLPVVRPDPRTAGRVPVRRRPLPREPRGEFYQAVPIGAHPLLWKELYHGTYGHGLGGWMLLVVAAPLLLPVCLVLLAMFLSALVDGRVTYLTFVNQYINPTIRVFCVLIGGFWVTSVAFQAGRSITREREQQTLDSLLMLPVDREHILGAKWLASVLRGRAFGYALVVFLFLGLITGAIHPLGVLLMALAFVIHIAFLASLGVSLSLASRTTLWANFTMALMLLLTFVGSWVVLLYSEALGGYQPSQGWWTTFSEYGLNPPRTWWHLGFTWQQFDRDFLHGGEQVRRSYAASLAGLLTFAVATGVFWLAACRQFRREQTRERA